MIWKPYIAPSWWLVQAIYTSKFSCWISSSSRKPCIKTWAVQWQGFSSVAKNTSCLDELFFVVSFLGSPGSIPACFVSFAVKFINKMWELPLWNDAMYLMWLNVLQDAPAWTIGIMGPMPWIQPKGDECDGKSPISSQQNKIWSWLRYYTTPNLQMGWRPDHLFTTKVFYILTSQEVNPSWEWVLVGQISMPVFVLLRFFLTGQKSIVSKTVRILEWYKMIHLTDLGTFGIHWNTKKKCLKLFVDLWFGG